MDRKGRPITNPRYQKRYWGYSGSVTVKAKYPLAGAKTVEAEITVELSDEIEASGMEDLA